METNKIMLKLAERLQLSGYGVYLILKEEAIKYIAFNKENEKRKYLLTFNQDFGWFELGQLCTDLRMGCYDVFREFSNQKLLEFSNECTNLQEVFYTTLECCRDENYIGKDSDYEQLFSLWIDENKYMVRMFLREFQTGDKQN